MTSPGGRHGGRTLNTDGVRDMFPTISRSELPILTTDQMREVDRSMVEDFGIHLIQMVENAGRNLATLARARFFDGNPRDRSATVLAGPGGNGAGALVCARRLASWGTRVSVVISAERSKLGEVSSHQLGILFAMGPEVTEAFPGKFPEPKDEDLLIDGLLGYGLSGAPREPVSTLLRWANTHAAPALSLDIPSGVDSTSGQVFEPAIRATATLTLALPKTGVVAEEAAEHVGELYLADISVPPELYQIPSLGLEVSHIFAESDILRVV